jgi:hypothetical protein
MPLFGATLIAVLLIDKTLQWKRKQNAMRNTDK